MVTYSSVVYIEGIKQEQKATISELSDGLVKIKLSSEHLFNGSVQIAWEDHDGVQQERLFIIQQRVNTNIYQVTNNKKYIFISQY